VHDVARIINPITHRGQIEGAITQGFGYAVMEDLTVDEGRVLPPSLGDYRLPTIRDVPPLELDYVEAATGPAPFEAKGVAEAGISTVAPVIANAVYNATSVRFTEIPITAEKMLAALRTRTALGEAVSPRS
jgi:xanthine dehydrogenase molybdenum-binding subunit